MLYYFFILVAFKDRQQIQNAIKWFVGLTLFMIPFSSVNFYFLGGKEQVDPQYWLDPREIFRFIRGTEGLLVAIVLVGLLLFYVFGEIRKHQVLLYILFGILLITVIMIQTRAVWLAAAVGIGAIGVLITLRLIRGRLPRQSLVLLIISGTLLLFTFSILVVSRASTIYTTAANELSFFQNPLADHTASWRLAGWQQELQKAMQNPLLGQGLGGYSEWFDGQIWQRVTIHNDYIMYFSKFGVIGLLLLFSGIFFWYLEMGRYTRVETDKYYKLLSRAIQIGVLMHMFFACFYYFTIFFWMLLAAGTVLARRNVSNKLVPQQEGINPATEASNT
jgi:O-antigen ligase